MQISRTASAARTTAPPEWFTGEAWIEPITKSPTQIDSVHFTPGSRTIWHRHPLGQVLVVTEGTGLVQREGGPVETITEGDTVKIAPDEWHWHGATPATAMTHLAIEETPGDGRTTEPGNPVTDYPGNTAPPVTRTTVLDQLLPTPHATHRVEIRRITIAPTHAAGLHVHNGPVFGAIEAGSVIYQIEGEPEATLNRGDTFYEPEATRIARFDAQQDGVTFLGYFLLRTNEEAELTFP
ncbi:(R)-mandelonitrile lyase [Kibdelosporangium phytohabitans]|nr:cupin domain-containing protein [Kibdelosporangium phytohabitans]MBE1471484.1 quercetin dioxygenase-like cupin family protein [Kibdelosporangium phytohabitans]